MRRLAALSIGVLALVAACGGSGDEPTPLAIVASTQGTLGVGHQRVMVALVDQDTNGFLAEPDRPATLLVADENGSPIGEYPTEFIWTVPDVRGLYVSHLTLGEAGTYQLTVKAEGLPDAGPVGMVVVDEPTMVVPGDQAPASETRTAADVDDLSEITSDPDPDPAMYELSIADAVTSGRASVIVFATPAFCQSQACGPLLDQVQALRPEFPDVDFVHAEVYEDLQVTDPEDLVAIPAVGEWGLPSEPWVFVVDSTGIVWSSFEGAAGDDELRFAIGAVAP